MPPKKKAGGQQQAESPLLSLGMLDPSKLAMFENDLDMAGMLDDQAKELFDMHSQAQQKKPASKPSAGKANNSNQKATPSVAK